MENYVYKRTKDGVHYLDVAKTWEKLMIAARIIAAVQRINPKDVLVSCARVSNAPFLYRSNALFLGCFEPPLRSESHPQVRNPHRGQLLRWQVGARYSDEPEH